MKFLVVDRFLFLISLWLVFGVRFSFFCSFAPRVCTHHGTPKPPTWSQNMSKSTPNGGQNSQLGPKRGTKGAKVGPKDPRWRLQERLVSILGLLDMKKMKIQNFRIRNFVKRFFMIYSLAVVNQPRSREI